MVLLMPSNDAKDLLKLHDYLVRNLQNTDEENLLDRIDREMKDPLANAEEVTLTMPMFKVKGDFGVKEVFKKVKIYIIIMCVYVCKFVCCFFHLSVHDR